MTTSAIDLLPCPFCGAEAERRFNTTLNDNSMAQCRSCGASAYDRKWNARVSTLPIAVEEPEGWQLVPINPTPEMVTDGRVTSSDVEKCEMISDYGKLFRSQWARALRASPVPSSSEAIHPDDLAVDRFAAEMKAKLAKKRAEGRGGWEDKDGCTAEFLSRLLREHVDKGDPVDVGNLAMMLQQRGERISSPGKDGGQEVEAVEEPVLFVSEQQLPTCIGTYLPTRKHREGNFKMPLYTSPQPASTALVEAARFLADRLEDFRQKIDDIDDEREFEGHIIPALARLRAALASQSTSREGER